MTDIARTQHSIQDSSKGKTQIDLGSAFEEVFQNLKDRNFGSDDESNLSAANRSPEPKNSFQAEIDKMFGKLEIDFNRDGQKRDDSELTPDSNSKKNVVALSARDQAMDVAYAAAEDAPIANGKDGKNESPESDSNKVFWISVPTDEELSKRDIESRRHGREGYGSWGSYRRCNTQSYGYGP